MNEPAFPSNRDMRHGPDWDYVEGMSLLDYFAAKILPTVYSDYCLSADTVGYVENWQVGVAKDAYRMAQAMLEVRKKYVV